MPPGWFSHPKGVYSLLDLLRTSLRAPSLPEAGRYITKFFYGLKRRKGETMAWLVRHDEALDDVKRTLCEAIRDYGKKAPRIGQAERSSTPQSPRSAYPPEPEQPFGDNGLMREEADVAGDYWGDEAWGDYGWKESGWQGSWSWKGSQAESYSWNDTGDHAAQQAQGFLPDFVVAWMLLQRSGLDLQEKSAIIANLKNDFSLQKVKDALRLTWSDEDLRKRDGQKQTAYVIDDDEGDVWEAQELEESEVANMTSEDQAAFHALEEEALAAYQQLQGARRTLREAREKQTFIRKNRKYYSSNQGNSWNSRSNHILRSPKQMLEVRKGTCDKGLPTRIILEGN